MTRSTSTGPDESTSSAGDPQSLTGRHPVVPADRLLGAFVPPRHFAHDSFDTYRPDPDFPSQAAARDRLAELAREVLVPRRRWARRREPGRGVYLDGGFGVGKTHLLASLAHAVGPERTAYGTFVEYTHLVGALGFAATVDALAHRALVCIDEFELDDPGDTMVMSRLLRELTDRGVRLAATSNTLPESLGEGRFAAEDFLREIQALAARFDIVRVEGKDYRHREGVHASASTSDDDVARLAAATPGATLDTFSDLVAHLARVHPSRYGALLDDVRLVAVTGVGPVPDQNAALRLVVLVDRLYDRDVPVALGGGGPATVFTEPMLAGGYRKKYLRALSRLGELTDRGNAVVGGPGA
ncbi:MAG: cell division protein ZapE [Actinomycetales bacterium]|nr:cell division protein ZapE [Actinomycetales bacterium]